MNQYLQCVTIPCSTDQQQSRSFREGGRLNYLASDSLDGSSILVARIANLNRVVGASGSDRFRISCGENSKSVWPQCPEIFEASERLSAHKATVATHVSLEPESAWPFRAQPVEPVVRFFRKSHCPGQKFVAKALRDIVVNYVCWDRAERLWQFGVRTKPACRPGRAAVRGCMLIDTRKPGRPTCGLRKTCRSVG